MRNYPKEVIRLALRGIFFWVFWIWMGYIMKEIIDWMNKWYWFESFIPLLILIVLLHIFKDAFWAFFRNLRLQLRNDIQKDLYAHYIHIYLQWQPLYTEQLWTWKTNSIFQKWCDNRVWLLESIAQDLIATVLPLILWILIIGSNFWIIWMLIIVLITLLLIRSMQKGEKKVALYRRKKKDIYTQADHHIVKTIMNKQEILQQQKIQEEKHIQTWFFLQVKELLNNESWWMIWFFDWPRMYTSILRLLRLRCMLSKHFPVQQRFFLISYLKIHQSQRKNQLAPFIRSVIILTDTLFKCIYCFPNISGDHFYSCACIRRQWNRIHNHILHCSQQHVDILFDRIKR